MNPENLRVLAERAASVEGRPVERLDQVHARIRRTRRRRQVGVIGAAVVAVVLALTAGLGLIALTGTDDTPPAKPAPRPTSTPSVLIEEAPSVRRLTYATGHKIHWGDRTIDVGSKVWEIVATDDGVVFMREGRQKRHDCFRYADGCNELWFTDGSDVVHIGTVYGSVIRGYFFASSSSGSTAVWFEPSPEDHPHGSGYDFTGAWVVYDVHERQEVARMETPRHTDRFGQPRVLIVAVFDDFVYWIPDDRDREWCREYSKPGAMCLHHRAVMRLNVATGAQTKVSWRAYVSDRLNRPRMFFASTYTADYPYNPTPGDHPGEEGVEFHRDGDRLVADYYGGKGVVTVRLAGTEEQVRLRPPRGYTTDTNVWHTAGWLDDTRLVLRGDNKDDLLVCRLPDGRCRVAVRGVQETDFGAHG